MAVPVVALRELDAYIPDTEIIVKIPEGVEGHIMQELRNDVVLVQFNVPSLGVLRVSLHDLVVKDSFDILISEMKAMQRTTIADKGDAHKEVDKVLIRAIRFLAEDTNREKVEYLLDLYQKAIRLIYSRKDKQTATTQS